MQKKILTN